MLTVLSVCELCTLSLQVAVQNLGPGVQMIHFNRSFFHLLPSRTFAPLLGNMTTSNPVLFATGHLDAGISAEHMLHGKQPQCSTQSKITKHNPGLKLFRPNQNAVHIPELRASRSSLLLFLEELEIPRLFPSEYNETVGLIAHSARAPWHCWRSQWTRKSNY